MAKYYAAVDMGASSGRLILGHMENGRMELEEIHRFEKKYHILKTNDNFYLYKNDIKRCLREMREDIPWMEQVQKKADKEKFVNHMPRCRRPCDRHHPQTAPGRA